MPTEGIVFNRALQLLPFLEAFERRGGETGPVLEAAGLAHFDLADPATLITGNALYRAIHEMALALDDPYFTARAAQTFVEAGPVFVRKSYAASHTLAEFLPLAILEIARQINNIRYSLRINADVAFISGQRAFTPTAPIIQADAGFVSMWATFLRLAVAEDFDAARLVAIAREKDGIPPEVLPGSSFLRRDWNGVEVGFPSEWLWQPLALTWEIPPTERGEFHEASPRHEILVWVEKVCLDLIVEKEFGLEALADHIGVHPKGLQRTLARLGTSFQELRDKVRREKAMEILSENKHGSNEEIADALGFANAASFSRAFRRWTGSSPSDYRRIQ
jgi:AraC-like DNA-binding protein